MPRNHDAQAMDERSTARQAVDPASGLNASEEEVPILCNRKPCMMS